MQEMPIVLPHQGVLRTRIRCVKCCKLHMTEQCTLSKTQPATCLHCGESHPTSYRGCNVYWDIIHTRFPSPRTTASIRSTNTQGPEKESPAVPQRTEEGPKMTYAQEPEIVSKRQQMQQTTHKTYTNQNNVRVLHKVRKNLVHTSWTNEHAHESPNHRI
jgi:hypothetical protein